MVHSDNKGLVLPPKVARTQVVVIPIPKKKDDAGNNKSICQKAEELYQMLKEGGIRVEIDDRLNHKPGFKFNHWELRGVPIRLELGPKDLENQEVRCCKRNDGMKMQLKQDTLIQDVERILSEI